MQAQAEADVAYYPPEAIVGRLRAGAISEGDLWVAESWVNNLVAVEAQGADLAPGIAAALRSRGTAPQAHARYRIATIDYVARERADLLGRIGSARVVGPLREVLVAHVRAQGVRSNA
jgi:hypothetical protein